jgi:hypothetical protein
MATGAALGKINVTSNLKSLEKEAQDAFRALEKAEKTFEPGLRFGRAMIDLRKSMKHGEWMLTLERLVITYRKADYWMDMVLWKNGERPSPRKPSVAMKKKKGVHSWQVADDWLDDLRNWVIQLRKKRPEGADRFAQSLIQLAGELQKKGKK